MSSDFPLILPDSITAPDSTPSARAGLDAETEARHRYFAADLIAQAGVLLELPAPVIATAQHTMHRFYYRRSFTLYDAFSVAAASTLLASKLEDYAVAVRAVIMVFHRVYQRRKHLKISLMELGGEQYNIWKQDFLFTERVILKELGFAFYEHIEHPYFRLLQQTKLYFVDVDPEELFDLQQRGWNYVNDSMRLDLCLRYRPEVIACAALYLAMADLEFPMMLVGTPWWTPIGCSTKEMVAAAMKILSIYDFPKIEWLEPVSPLSPWLHSKCLIFDRPSSGPQDDYIGIPGIDSTTGEPLRADLTETAEDTIARPVAVPTSEYNDRPGPTSSSRQSVDTPPAEN